MISLISEMLSYPFMVKAIFVGLLISISSALLGITLVLKRYAMIGVGLSNVSFAALSIALSFDIYPIEFSMPIVIIAGIIILKYVDIYNICVLPLQYKIQEGGIYEILFNVWIRKKFIAKRL